MRAPLAVWKVTLLIALFVTIFGNFSFWKSFLAIAPITTEPLLALSFLVFLVTLTNLLLTAVSFKPIFKPVAILMLLTSACAAYFMDSYGVMIDKGMIQNTLNTNMNEATELFSVQLVITVLLLGVLPAWGLYKIDIDYRPLLKGLLHKVVIVLIGLGVITGTLYSNYQELSFFSRNNRELRHLINPENYIISLKKVVAGKISNGKVIVKAIENDARKKLTLEQRDKPSLIILVLGETARAMSFSLNGYKRETNPLLVKEDIVNFNHVSSCGTATAVSVPCMFSKFSRENYSGSKGEQYQNLLDVVSHAGFDVLWRDNNTGCQGVCQRIAYEDLAHKELKPYCDDDNCVDEILLHDLQNYVDKTSGDKFIILHQKGNHGPTYHRRYPDNFEVFKPVCKTNQLRSCSKEEIVNSYDNAILYSDYFLTKTIHFLKENSAKYNTSFVYISDHGESLGENNLYLHGLPYVIAPDEQKKVPFLLWMSEGYQQSNNIDLTCMSEKSTNELSHDNLFSSMLGLLAIQTKVYEGELDIFSSCKKARMVQNL